MQPLSNLRVLDFTTLLPGPLATLYLAEAGARVVKVERPEGDPGRTNKPERGKQSLQFALLNRGKIGLVADLKDPSMNKRIRDLAIDADVLVEQFRPGVMGRLGLGYEDLRNHNPGLVYCSITGFGQDGPLARRAGHDLTYMARAGMLRLTADPAGKPALPPGQIADVGGGSLSAVISILTALHHREKTGKGAHLDISMTENLFPWIARALAPVFDGALPPAPGRGRHTGGSPRYGVHLSSDGVAFAIAPLEEKFWQTFCGMIGVPEDLRGNAADPEIVSAEIERRMAARSAAELEAMFEGQDVCVERVRDTREAVDDEHFSARGTFERRISLPDGSTIPAIPMPFPNSFLGVDTACAPDLGVTKQERHNPWGEATGWKG